MYKIVIIICIILQSMCNAVEITSELPASYESRIIAINCLSVQQLTELLGGTIIEF